MPSASCCCALALSSTWGCVGSGGSMRAYVGRDRRPAVTDDQVLEDALAFVFADIYPDVWLRGSDSDFILDLCLGLCG